MGDLDRDGNATLFLITEKSKEANLEFLEKQYIK